MKIIFFGTSSFVAPILETLFGRYDTIAVVTAPDTLDRKGKPVPSPIKKTYQRLLDEAITKPTQQHIFTPDKLTTIYDTLKDLQPDLFVVASYGKIIPQSILEIPQFGAINVHPSLLPAYRGPSPIPQAILNGDTITGVTLIKMDDKMDHGPILAAEPFTIHDTDTFETLANHLFGKANDILPSTIDTFVAGKIMPKEQDHEKASFTKLMTKQQGFIDSNNPPEKQTIDRMIRAYYPWPCAWTTIEINNKNVRMKLLPGDKVQIEGKNAMTVKDFLNGYPQLAKNLSRLLGDL